MRRFGLLLAAISAVAVIASSAVAQSAPWRVVQASDGSLYLVKDGARYTLVPDPISDDDLASLPDGGVIGATLPTVDAPQPPTTAPQAPPPAASAPLAPATAGVQFDTVASGRPGQTARVVVRTDPGATCSIEYVTPSGTVSRASGLGPATADAAGIASWSWLIGTATRTGNGTVTVTCNGVTTSTAIAIG